MNALVWSVPGVALAVAAALAALPARLGRLAGWLAAGAAAYATGASIVLAGSGLRTSTVWFEAGRLVFTVGLRTDGIAVSFALLVASMSAVVNVYAIGYMRGREGRARFFAWMAFFQGSMLALVLADSFLVLFAAWEAVGIASWALIAHEHDRAEARRAGAQAFLVTRLGDLAMLGAWLAAVLATASSDLDPTLAAAASGRLAPGFAVALAFLFLVAALAKSAQLPLSAWLPTAMIGPTPVSALLHSATMVAAGAFLVIRLWPLFEAAPLALGALRWIGLTTAVAAALAATAQDDLKAVLAWSTVDQLGLMMLALGIYGPGAATLHLFTHAVFKAGLFLVAGIVDEGTGTRSLSRLGGLSRAMPWGAATFGACALALAALPPFAGFVSGDEILARAAATGAGWGGAVVALVGIAGVYAGRAFAGVFSAWPGARTPRLAPAPATMLGASLVLGAGSILAGWAFRGALSQALPFAPAAEVSAWWRFLGVAASTAGLAVGIGGTRARGPVPLLGRWVGAVPTAAALLTSAAARAGVAFAATSEHVEAGLDRAASAAGRRAGSIAAVAAFAEQLLDRASRRAGVSVRAAGRAAGVVESRGVSDGLDRAAAAIGTVGDRVRHTQAGPVWVYTATVTAFLVAAAVAAILAAFFDVSLRLAGG